MSAKKKEHKVTFITTASMDSILKVIGGFPETTQVTNISVSIVETPKKENV